MGKKKSNFYDFSICLKVQPCQLRGEKGGLIEMSLDSLVCVLYRVTEYLGRYILHSQPKIKKSQLKPSQIVTVIV